MSSRDCRGVAPHAQSRPIAARGDARLGARRLVAMQRQREALLASKRVESSAPHIGLSTLRASRPSRLRLGRLNHRQRTYDPENRRSGSADAVHRVLQRSAAHSFGAGRISRTRHRGVPEPVPAARRGPHAAAGMERGGDRALRHDPARDRPSGHARPRSHPQLLALRPERREVLLQVGTRVQGRPPGGHQPPAVRPAAGRLARAALAVERHRRGVPLPRRRQGLHAQGPEDGRGLDPRAPVQAGPGRHRRHELRRRDASSTTSRSTPTASAATASRSSS